MQKNISAFTAAGSDYPAFITINQRDRQDDVEITVRGRARANKEKGYPEPGEIVDISLTHDEFISFVTDIVKNFPKAKPDPNQLSFPPDDGFGH